MIDFSIIIPVYFNSGCINKLMDSLKCEVLNHNSDLKGEIIFIDDGSGDNSLNELINVYENNKDCVKIIKLTRNFGQVNAILAGYAKANGQCVINISADGQDPVTLINCMIKYHFEDNYDVVICTRIGRDESYFRIITSKLFYYLIRKYSFTNMPIGGFDYVLLSKRAKNIYLRNIDANTFFQANVLWMGFKTKFIEYYRNARISGKSKWTFGRKVTYLIDGLMSYSFLPIRLISLVGLIFSIIGFLYALIVLISKITIGNPIQGWTPLMIVVLVMGGIQMLMLGIMGEYLWRVLSQARNREHYVIDKIFE